MKKLILFLAVCLAASAASPVSFLGTLVRCPGTSAAFVMWSGTAYECVTMGPGLTITNGVLTATAVAPTPTMQVETISLGSLASGATTTTYTTMKTPISGVVFYFYNGSSLLATTGLSGAITYAGNPLTFTLPAGWSASDTITVVYQSQ